MSFVVGSLITVAMIMASSCHSAPAPSDRLSGSDQPVQVPLDVAFRRLVQCLTPTGVADGPVLDLLDQELGLLCPTPSLPPISDLPDALIGAIETITAPYADLPPGGVVARVRARYPLRLRLVFPHGHAVAGALLARPDLHPLLVRTETLCALADFGITFLFNDFASAVSPSDAHSSTSSDEGPMTVEAAAALPYAPDELLAAADRPGPVGLVGLVLDANRADLVGRLAGRRDFRALVGGAAPLRPILAAALGRIPAADFARLAAQLDPDLSQFDWLYVFRRLRAERRQADLGPIVLSHIGPVYLSIFVKRLIAELLSRPTTTPADVVELVALAGEDAGFAAALSVHAERFRGHLLDGCRSDAFVEELIGDAVVGPYLRRTRSLLGGGLLHSVLRHGRFALLPALFQYDTDLWFGDDDNVAPLLAELDPSAWADFLDGLPEPRSSALLRFGPEAVAAYVDTSFVQKGDLGAVRAVVDLVPDLVAVAYGPVIDWVRYDDRPWTLVGAAQFYRQAPIHAYLENVQRRRFGPASSVAMLDQAALEFLGLDTDDSDDGDSDVLDPLSSDEDTDLQADSGPLDGQRSP